MTGGDDDYGDAFKKAKLEHDQQREAPTEAKHLQAEADADATVLSNVVLPQLQAAAQKLEPLGATAGHRSGNERTALLLLCFVRGARRSRQLQHGRVLTFREPGEQHDLPVGELQRIVMHVLLLHLDLPESSYLLPYEFLASGELKNMLAFDFRLECDLRARKKTHSYMRFSDDGETTSERIIERRCHQLVSDLRRP